MSVLCEFHHNEQLVRIGGRDWAKESPEAARARQNRMDTYTPAREVTPAFLQCVQSWVEQDGEVLVLLRYLRAAGSRDWALCRTWAHFETIVNWAPRGTDIMVFRDAQLPFRGVVDDVFIASVLAGLPDREEYVLIAAEHDSQRGISTFSTEPDHHDDLRDYLDDRRGVEVAVGLAPDYTAPDHDGLISAAKDGVDGPR